MYLTHSSSFISNFSPNPVIFLSIFSTPDSLIEAAKLAPNWNPQLAAVCQKAKDRGANKNEATIEVARMLVAYLLYVDKTGKRFQLKENMN